MLLFWAKPVNMGVFSHSWCSMSIYRRRGLIALDIGITRNIYFTGLSGFCIRFCGRTVARSHANPLSDIFI